MDKAATEYDVDMPDLADKIEKLIHDKINALSFGVIRLDGGGNVVLYSDLQRSNSGLRKEVLNRSYFTDIAPCLNNDRFRGRIEQAMAQGSLDISFDYTADLPSGARDVDMRVRVQSASGGGCWIFVKVGD